MYDDYCSNNYDVYLESLDKIKKEDKMNSMYDLFKVGDKIYGFCDGFFGKDDYSNKKCTFVTSKYAIFEYKDDSAIILNYTEQLALYYSDKWKDPKNEVEE